MRKCGKCGAVISDREDVCPYCGADYVEPAAEETVESRPGETAFQETPVNRHPMKWHNFLMVTMIIGAVLTIINGITSISGMAYTSQGLDASQVYSYYPGLRSTDLLYGFAAICIGVFQLYVRNQLHAFRQNAPGKLKILYIVSLAADIIDLDTVSSMLKVSAFDTSSLAMMGSTIASFIINTIYYSKRSDLFVN